MSDNEDDDGFFGDDDDGDVLPQRDNQALEAQLRNVGFLEAFEESKEEHLQRGFEDGYRQGFDASVRIGELLGEAALQGDAQVVTRIKEFLEQMGKSKSKPSVSQEELEQLELELKESRQEK